MKRTPQPISARDFQIHISTGIFSKTRTPYYAKQPNGELEEILCIDGAGNLYKNLHTIVGQKDTTPIYH